MAPAKGRYSQVQTGSVITSEKRAGLMSPGSGIATSSCAAAVCARNTRRIGCAKLLPEYCVDFPDLGFHGPRGRLPASDDVLAKWMALTGDEKRLINEANMHLPGRQVDPGRVRRDLWRLQMWERERRDSATGAKER